MKTRMLIATTASTVAFLAACSGAAVAEITVQQVMRQNIARIATCGDGVTIVDGYDLTPDPGDFTSDFSFSSLGDVSAAHASVILVDGPTLAASGRLVCSASRATAGDCESYYADAVLDLEFGLTDDSIMTISNAEVTPAADGVWGGFILWDVTGTVGTAVFNQVDTSYSGTVALEAGHVYELQALAHATRDTGDPFGVSGVCDFAVSIAADPVVPAEPTAWGAVQSLYR